MTAPEPILPGGNGRLDARSVAACCTQLRHRATDLRQIPTHVLIDALADLMQKWRDPEYTFRREAEGRIGESTGFSAPVVRWGLDALFAAWDRAGMEALILSDLGDLEALDRFVPLSMAREGGARSQQVRWRAVGPALTVHVLAGNVPSPALQSLFAALLARSPGFLKASSREPWFPTLLVRSIEAEIPALRGCVACASWPGGELELEAALFAAADVVVAYGSDETLASIQARVLPPARVVARGNRLSIGYVAREALEPGRASGVARGLAIDTAVFDQAGCLSPHVVLVERGGALSPEALARLLAAALQEVQLELPAGLPSIEQAAAAMQLKGVHAFTGEVIEGDGFAVILQAEGAFAPSCLGRVLLVRAVEDISEAVRWLEPAAGLLQAVALAADEPHRTVLAQAFGALGAGRICAPGVLQRPPAAWAGDGRPILGELVRRVSLEPAASGATMP